MDVTCTTEAGAVVTGYTRDVSVGGAFIESSGHPPFGSKVTMVMSAPGQGDLRVSAIVRWTQPDGFGVQFQLLGAKETYVIARLMRGKSG
jgi:hypothetical protein